MKLPFAAGRLPRDLSTAALWAAIFALFGRTFVALPVHVPTESMATTLLPGDHVLTHRSAFTDPSRGEVVLLRKPGDPSSLLVKRCIGLPGETLQVESSGRVLVDGWALREPYVSSDAPRSGSLRIELADDEFFVLGDHRAASTDSRHWGTVERSAILGRVILVYWSVPPQPDAVGTSGPWGMIRASSIGRLLDTRWERAFHWVR